MLFWTTIKLALKSLFANKLRSFLAMLGIIIGVGSVISMLALASGASKQVMERIASMGTNLLIVRPGQSGHRGVMSGTQQNLTIEDAQAIINKISGIAQVAPVVSGGAQLKYSKNNTRSSVIGTAITYFPIRNFEIEKGRPFTDGEAERMARVAVVGPVTIENLFENEDPLSKNIKINGINFRVIGILKSKGDQGWFNPDDQVIVPYKTAMKQLFGLSYLREIDIQVAEGADFSKVQEEITNLLRKNHRLQAEVDDDFNIRSQAEMIETTSSVSRTFTILLGSIAGISLLVGGIGIMNIMLVTVTERTREIGVRKAVGARNRDILRQFLVEAILMSSIGGIMGVGAGIGTADIIGRFTNFPTVVGLLSVVSVLLFSAAVGIFFGYYPAYRAAKLDPIEALRYE